MRKCPIPWGTGICEENGPNTIFTKKTIWVSETRPNNTNQQHDA